MTVFVAEISSNHNGDLQRCRQLIAAAATAGCHAVKFQLFRLEKLFAPEILQVSAEHRLRRRWELPPWFLPELVTCAHDHGLLLGCTPFDLEAVDLLAAQVDFLKIASYELPWLPLVRACATTGMPLMMSTGMATRPEITAAVETAGQAGCADLTLFHCVSSYPAVPAECNLAAISTLRSLAAALIPKLKVGWSDHSVSPQVVRQAMTRWNAEVIEFHFDLEGQGLEFSTGHCWLPATIAPVINEAARTIDGDNDDGGFDGDGHLGPSPCEKAERPWRADPQDGLRPRQNIRKAWVSQHDQAHPAGPRLLMIPYGPGWGHLMRCVALAETLRHAHQADLVFLPSDDPGQAAQLQRHGFSFIAMPGVQATWSPPWLHAFKLRLTALLPTGLDAAVVDTAIEPEPVLNILAEAGVATVLLDKPTAPPTTLGIVPSLTWSPSGTPAHLVGGPEFLLIREDVRALRPPAPPTTCDGPVVISFGGTDPHQLTELCLRAVAKAMPEVPVQVVVGPGFCHGAQRLSLLQKTRSNVQIILTTGGLEQLVAQAGLVITAYGITVAEAMCLGRPCAVIGFRPQDEAEISQLAKANLVAPLGQHPQIQTADMGPTLAAIWRDQAYRLDLARAGWSYCPGEGAQLAANHLMTWLKTSG